MARPPRHSRPFLICRAWIHQDHVSDKQVHFKHPPYPGLEQEAATDGTTDIETTGTYGQLILRQKEQIEQFIKKQQKQMEQVI